MGGSSGGGGSSTSVTYMYPEWVRGFYERANNATWADAEAAKADNPYKNAPISVAELIASIGSIGRWVDRQIYAYDPKELFDLLISGPDNVPNSIFALLNRDEIKDAIKGQAASIMRVTEEEVLPVFRRGMQTIGAVNTSSFKIGEALLWRGQLDSLNEKYYDKLVAPAFEKSLENIDKLQELYFRKLSTVLMYAELQMKIDESIYNARQNEADINNTFRASQLSWGLEIDKMLVMAAGSWQSTPQSSETKVKEKSDSTSNILGGILGAGSIITSLFSF